jgi:hypothetical protein
LEKKRTTTLLFIYDLVGKYVFTSKDNQKMQLLDY